MSATALVALSRRGAGLARALAGSLAGGTDLYLDRRFLEAGDVAQSFELPLRPVVGQVLREYPAVVLFLPVGAAVRLIAPFLQDKHQDPAVVCVDDAGRFAVSLVSGHVGGADRLAQEVARVLGATPVVTSGSHVTETLAVDLMGRELGWSLEAESAAVTRASAAVVNGDPVGVYQSAGEPDWWPEIRPLPPNLTVYPSLASLGASSCSAALIISDESNPIAGKDQTLEPGFAGKTLILYRPRSLSAGMGCRRGVPVAELERLLVDTFHEHNLSLSSLGCIATAELKRDEPGLLALAEQYGVPLICYSGDQLNSVYSQTPAEAAGGRAGNIPGLVRSERAHALLGIWGVAEPAALLASGDNRLLVPKQKGARATVAVARKRF